MKSIKKYLRLYPLYLSMAIKTRLNYKADAIVGIIGFILANLASFFSLFLVVQTIPDLYGWDLNMMTFLYGCVLIPKAIDHMFTDNLWTLAGMMVRMGTLNRMMVRPINVLFQIVAENFQHEGLGELILGVTFVCIYAPMLNISASWDTILAFILCTVVAIFLFTGIKLIFASLAFWLKRSIGILNSVYALSDYARYPVKVFGDVVGSFLLFVIPFALVLYKPVESLLTPESAWFGGNMWAIY